MTGLSSDDQELTNTERIEVDFPKTTIVNVIGYAKTHVTFMLAYWISFITAFAILHLFHSPEIYWFYSFQFAYDLLILLLSLLPLLTIVSLNIIHVRKLLNENQANRSPVFVSGSLVGLAFVLLIPIIWFWWNPTIALIVMPEVTALILLLTVLVYLVSAGAIITDDPLTYVRNCLQQPRFWLSFLLTCLVIAATLIPMVFGILSSEAWQYYSYTELLIRRLPGLVIFSFPAALLMPILPLIIEKYASKKQIRWSWM